MKIALKKSFKSYPELSVKLGQAAAGKVLTHEEWFDNNGNKVHEKIYSAQGKPEQDNWYEFDEEGRLVLQRFHFLHEDLQEETKWIYQNGKLAAKSIHFGFGEDEEFSYQHDDQDRLLAIIRASDQKASEDFVYESSRLIRHRIYDEEGNLQFDHQFSYDGEGRKTEEIRHDFQTGEQIKTCFKHSDKPEPDLEIYHADSELAETLIREYKDQQIIKIIQEYFIPEAEILVTEFSYFSDGKQEGSTMTDSLGQLLMQTKIEYADHGHPIAEHRNENHPQFGALSLSTHFEYQFFGAEHES